MFLKWKKWNLMFLKRNLKTFKTENTELFIKTEKNGFLTF